jgi:hypothetical protein
MDRGNWDKIVSGAGAVIAVVLIALGAMAIYGGNFGQQNVRDRLEPQNISFFQSCGNSDRRLSLSELLGGSSCVLRVDTPVRSALV